MKSTFVLIKRIIKYLYEGHLPTHMLIRINKSRRIALWYQQRLGGVASRYRRQVFIASHQKYLDVEKKVFSNSRRKNVKWSKLFADCKTKLRCFWQSKFAFILIKLATQTVPLLTSCLSLRKVFCWLPASLPMLLGLKTLLSVYNPMRTNSLQRMAWLTFKTSWHSGEIISAKYSPLFESINR